MNKPRPVIYIFEFAKPLARKHIFEPIAKKQYSKSSTEKNKMIKKSTLSCVKIKRTN
jgi:hypothetical protein